MRRRLFSILCGLSFLLFVAAVALWADCRSHSSSLWYGTDEKIQFSIEADQRNVVISNVTAKWPEHDAAVWHYDHDEPSYIAIRDCVPQSPSMLGFHVPTRRLNGRTGIVMPYWFVLLVPAVLPAMWSWRFWTHAACRRHRIRNGLCLQCGYDLRATPSRCPECGTIPATAQP